jgi:hypothetical protein
MPASARHINKESLVRAKNAAVIIAVLGATVCTITAQNDSAHRALSWFAIGSPAWGAQRRQGALAEEGHEPSLVDE